VLGRHETPGESLVGRKCETGRSFGVIQPADPPLNYTRMCHRSAARSPPRWCAVRLIRWGVWTRNRTTSNALHSFDALCVQAVSTGVVDRGTSQKLGLVGDGHRCHRASAPGHVSGSLHSGCVHH
jgi:hypothetical protein